MGSVTKVVLFLLFVITYQKSNFSTSLCRNCKKIVTFGKCYELCIVFLVSYRVSGVFFQTSSCIIYTMRGMLGKCYERCLVYLVTYRVSRVILSDLFRHNL